MAPEATNQHPVSEQPMKPIGTQYTCASSMSMWMELVEIASQRYEELLEEEKRQKQRSNEAETASNTSHSSDDDSMHSDQSISLIRSAEISIGENVTIGDADDEDDERLIIDESSLLEEDNASEVNESNASTDELDLPQQQRESVIQPCINNNTNVVDVKPKRPTEHRDEESPRVNQPVTIAKAETSKAMKSTPMRPLNGVSRVTLNRCKPYLISYNKNMARKFPGAENRTPEQQAVRERNTIAARQSRAKMRMMDDLLQQEATNERTHNQYMKERLSGLFMYANALREKVNEEPVDYLEEFEKVKDVFVPGPLRTHKPREQSQPAEENQIAEATSPARTAPVARRLDLSVSEPETEAKPKQSTNDSETDSVPEPEEAILDLSKNNQQDIHIRSVVIIREVGQSS